MKAINRHTCITYKAKHLIACYLQIKGFPRIHGSDRDHALIPLLGFHGSNFKNFITMSGKNPVPMDLSLL